jgi:hypothetical protein
MARRKPKTRKKKKTKKKTRKMVSIKQYKYLIQKRQHHKRMTRLERKQLDQALLTKYCSCITKLKNNKAIEKNVEYPICFNSIYKKRGFKSPRGVSRKCYK